jgi:hypothetical protein
MSDGKYEEDVLALTKDSWHGKEDMILPRGTSVEEGTRLSRMDEIHWTTRPLYVEVEPGKFIPFGDKKALTRVPNAFSSVYHVVDSRVVRDYEAINNDFMMELAAELARITGWTFEGCGTLRHNEISFIQLRLTHDYHVGNREYERHSVRFLYGDDKAAGSGFAGLNYTRVQCMNTFFCAIGENGILKVDHRDNPQARWKLINAGAAEVIKGFEEQNKMLDLFYFMPMDTLLFQQFVEETYPMPKPSRAMTEAEQARELLDRGQADGIDLSVIFTRGERASQRYHNDTALILRRRNMLEAAYAKHNARYPDSAETLYAALQALTYLANHTDAYRGDVMTGILFGGKRAQDIQKGFNSLKLMAGLE